MSNHVVTQIVHEEQKERKIVWVQLPVLMKERAFTGAETVNR